MISEEQILAFVSDLISMNYNDEVSDECFRRTTEAFYLEDGETE